MRRHNQPADGGGHELTGMAVWVFAVPGAASFVEVNDLPTNPAAETFEVLAAGQGAIGVAGVGASESVVSS